MDKAPPYSPNAVRLKTIARTIQSWIDWNKEGRTVEGLTTEDGTAIMGLPVPYWPTHGAMRLWVEEIRKADDLVSSMKEALERSVKTVDDLLCARVAPELCHVYEVADSRQRIAEGGGTLAYIADSQECARAAIRAHTSAMEGEW